jgi:outer membrane immunogenic protein
MAIRNKALACTFGGGALIAFGFATSAQADGYMAPRSGSPLSWTGFYVGAHGGVAWLNEDGNFDPLFNGAVNTAAWNRSPESFRIRDTSGVGGVQLGYNAQVGPGFLLGVEWDWSWTGLKDTQTVDTRNGVGVPFAPASPAFMSTEVNWLTSVRGRIGVVTSGALFYATGGFAAGDVRQRSHLASVPPGTNWDASFDDTQTGFVVGGGAEYKLSHNLLLRAEYLHYDLSGATSTVDGVPANFPGFQIRYHWDRTEVDVARVGLSYQFSADRYVPLK